MVLTTAAGVPIVHLPVTNDRNGNGGAPPPAVTANPEPEPEELDEEENLELPPAETPTLTALSVDQTTSMADMEGAGDSVTSCDACCPNTRRRKPF